MLIIIDLQEYYLEEFRQQEKKFQNMLQCIQQRITEAEKNQETIINLTHMDDGFTIPEITEELNKKRNKYFIGKNGFDGSASIHFFSKKKNLDTSSIELCGAFYDCCVLKTWEGLKKRGYNVQPVKKELVIRTRRKRKVKYPKGYFYQENQDDMETKYTGRKQSPT